MFSKLSCAMKEYREIPLATMLEERKTNELAQDAKITEVSATKEKREKPVDLDDILVNEIGQFGRYQIQNILLVSLPLLMSAFSSEYIFSAAAIPHRCRIPECGESSKNSQFEPIWLMNAVPKSGSDYSSCQRYGHDGSNGSLDYCPPDMFNRDNVTACESYVYGKNNSVVYDFELGCKEWIRVLAGTINRFGTLLALPITSYFSDRFGRRLALIISTFCFSLFGTLRAFSTSYNQYLALQLLQTGLGSGLYSSAYIFAAELVGPKYRVLIGAICPSTNAVGSMLLGGVASAIHSWRNMILVLHVPCFIIVSYYWLLDESVRWLLSKKKYNKTISALEKVAKINKTKVSKESIKELVDASVETETKPIARGLITSIFRSNVLLRRVCTTPFWWIATTFVYHGFSINSITLSDAMYLNYILTCGVEIPGNFAAIYVLDRWGRKPTLSGGFLLCAACNVVLIFTPSEYKIWRLTLYLLGKFGISVVVTSLYLFTSELYPTEYRHSLLAFSSMIGRIGSITAPLTPALTVYWEGVPTVLFGGMGLLAGLLVFIQPETLGTKLPDTLAEAEGIGRRTNQKANSLEII